MPATPIRPALNSSLIQGDSWFWRSLILSLPTAISVLRFSRSRVQREGDLQRRVAYEKRVARAP